MNIASNRFNTLPSLFHCYLTSKLKKDQSFTNLKHKYEVFHSELTILHNVSLVRPFIMPYGLETCQMYLILMVVDFHYSHFMLTYI